MKTQRKGFTLIELMVVIVIIGILAAIAIPKLFGMSAKAKASEVGPAAGTWSKLQQAYITETSKMGSAVAIGYTPPGATMSTESGTTSNFSYLVEGSDAGGYEASWSAKAEGALNDCKGDGAVWSVIATMGQEANSPDYAFNIGGQDYSRGALASGSCGSLTPNFPKLQ